jgi:hypothetical protein
VKRYTLLDIRVMKDSAIDFLIDVEEGMEETKRQHIL